MQALKDLQLQLSQGNKTDYSAYRDNPVGFGEEILGDQYTDDVKRLMESVRDNEITIARSANGTGKSHAAARIAAWFLLCFDNVKVFTAAAPPENNLKTILWGELGSVVRKNAKLFESYSITSLQIAPKDTAAVGNIEPDTFIQGLTIPTSGSPKDREAKFSGKHAPVLVFILDEGDAIPDEVYKGIESCMSGGTIVRLLIMFNPREESGEVYRMERDKRAHVVELSAFHHPNVITGENIIPGAVTRGTTIRRINQWCRRMTDREETNEYFDLPDFLVGKTTEMPSRDGMYPPLEAGRYQILNSAFSYMVLGQYPAQGTKQLISREWVYAARARWDAYVSVHGMVPPAGTRPTMGLDVAEYGDDSTVASFLWGGWLEPLVAWQGVDRVLTTKRAIEEYKQRGAIWCKVDASGLGKWIAPNMDNCNAYSVYVGDTKTTPIEEGDFKSVRCQIMWMVREWLRTDPGAMLPPDEMLIEELLCPTYKYTKKGTIEVMDKDTMREKLKRSPDRLDSLELHFAPSTTVVDPLDLDKCAR